MQCACNDNPEDAAAAQVMKSSQWSVCCFTRNKFDPWSPSLDNFQQFGYVLRAHRQVETWACMRYRVGSTVPSQPLAPYLNKILMPLHPAGVSFLISQRTPTVKLSLGQGKIYTLYFILRETSWRKRYLRTYLQRCHKDRAHAEKWVKMHRTFPIFFEI